MENAFNIIVLILSGSLFVFLVLAIIATVYVVKLVKQLRSIAESGKHIASQAENLTSNIVQSAATGSFISAVGKLVSVIKKFK